MSLKVDAIFLKLIGYRSEFYKKLYSLILENTFKLETCLSQY